MRSGRFHRASSAAPGRRVIAVVRRERDAVRRGEQPTDVVQQAHGERLVDRFTGVPCEHAARTAHRQRVQPQPVRVVGWLDVEHQVGHAARRQRPDERTPEHHRRLTDAADASRVAEVRRVGRAQHAGRQRRVGHDRSGDVTPAVGRAAQDLEHDLCRGGVHQQSVAVARSGCRPCELTVRTSCVGALSCRKNLRRCAAQTARRDGCGGREGTRTPDSCRVKAVL